MREGIKRTPMELLRAVIEEQRCEMPCGTLHEIHGDRRNICGDRDCIECKLDAMRKAADLVEEELDALKARALPDGMEWLVEAWPRFEDDSPVHFGDMALIDGDADMVEAVQIWIHGKPVIYGDNGSQQLEKGERVKRPAPKVLDADGVEIRVGDTVCGTRDMEPMRVVDTDSRECGFKHIKCEKEGDGFWFYCPDELTHKLPVLAADGKPLREGETVWDGKGNGPYIIKKIEDDGIVRIDSNDLDYFASEFFSERPDSWELIEEEKGLDPFDYCKKVGHKLWTFDNAEEFKASDLVRRCRALAERGER